MGLTKRKIDKMAKYSIPEGYKKAIDDVVGYWDSDDGPLHFIPRSAKVFDGNIDPTKPSTLIIGELVGNHKIRLAKPEGAAKNEKGELIEAQSGSPVGVWGKPGMKKMKMLADCKVFMYEDGEKKTGKPNPMKLFSIDYTGPGNKLIPVAEDTRKESASATTLLTGPRVNVKHKSSQVPGNNPADDDDIPF